MQTQGPATAREIAPLAGDDDFAAGLMLVRASTLKLIRLQLALERQDRRVALEEVDDLLALDRRLDSYLAAAPPGDGSLSRQLDAERSLLNREKLALAAGVRRAPEPFVEPAPVVQQVEPGADDWLGAEELSYAEQPRRRSPGWLVIFVLVAVALFVGASFVGLPAMEAWLAGVAGDWR